MIVHVLAGQASMKMITYLHFIIGDDHWFLGWAPKNAGAWLDPAPGAFNRERIRTMVGCESE
jgi:hypothetical protein